MRILINVCFIVGILVFAAAGQPVVQQGGVVNAASYAIPGLPNHGIAQGSMFVVFGLGLGPPALRQADALPYSSQLAGTSIQVTVGGVTRDAIMVYTSERQVAAILPSSTPTGDGTLTVTYEGRTSPPRGIHVVESLFGIFTRNQAGSGPAIVQNYNSPADQPVNALTVAAHPGQTMTLWGTGLGPVDFDDAAAPQARNLDVHVEVLVGGKNASVLYRGRSPQFPGIDQINFQLPLDVATGCHVPLVARTVGGVSNFTTIAISSQSEICSDIASRAAADLQIAQRTGELKLGVINLIHNVAKGEGALDLGLAEFDHYDYPTLLKVLEIGSGPRMTEAGIPPFGTCNVLSGRNESGSAWSSAVDPTVPRGMDAGPWLTVSGPRGYKELKKRTDRASIYGGYIGGTIPGFANFGAEFLAPGVYQADNGSGTEAVGPFAVTRALPAPPEWTNQESIRAVSRTQDLVLTWSGGDSTKEYVYIRGLSNDGTTGASATFLCTEQVSAGSITVPAFVLSALPASGTSAGRPTGDLEVGLAPLQEAARFQIAGLDAAYFLYEVSYWKILSYQ